MPYLVRTLHKNLHRIASLAVCASVLPTSRSSTPNAVADAYRALLTRRVSVPEERQGEVLSYVRERAMTRKYPHAADEGALIEIQDYFLSDGELKSRSGAEREQTALQTVQVVRELGLAHPETLIRSTFGDLLVAVAERTNVVPFPLGSDGLNPFSANPQLAISAYYQLARNDWGLQEALLGYFQQAEGALSFYAHVCTAAPALLRTASGRVPSTVANRVERDWVTRQIAAADRFDREIGSGGRTASEQTLRRPLEDLFLPRLELMVDVGLLIKPDATRFTYAHAPTAATMSTLFDRGPEELDRGYFAAIASALNRNTVSVARGELLEHLTSAYEVLKNEAGYASIRESAILANSLSWSSDPWRIVEVAEAFQALSEFARESGPRVRINADRYRRPFTFRLVGS